VPECRSKPWDDFGGRRILEVRARPRSRQLLALCGLTRRESYFDMVMVAIVGATIALVAVIALGSALGSF